MRNRLEWTLVKNNFVEFLASLRCNVVMLLLLIHDDVEFVNVHLSSSPSLANSCIAWIDCAKVTTECFCTSGFHCFSQIFDPSFDRSCFIVFFVALFSIAEKSSTMSKVIQRATKFKEFNPFIRGAITQNVRQQLLSSVVTFFNVRFFKCCIK